ncbi:hypothetical protein AXG93_1299s1210 [Marchantia polymorpha subsp. ruderalis]|uniref:Uncharacterized protein n=1 Tax=Marchantia polymorpha subsp. ruderalis TaxID=1480154 RepID=A0A176WMZ6_MARPO|nr:hypothetical protein AXG93_1299s1210 [Marchantia polymorpha subsp. ruderalis]
MSSIRARPKKKVNRRGVVSDSSVSSVAKSDAAASTMDEGKREESTLRVVEGGTSGVQVEVPMEVVAESSEKRTATVGGTVVDAPEIPSLSPPQEDVRPEAEKKTSEEEPNELDVAFLDFLHDSVIPLLNYLDKKRERNTKELGFYVELVRNMTQIKRVIAE